MTFRQALTIAGSNIELVHDLNSILPIPERAHLAFSPCPEVVTISDKDYRFIWHLFLDSDSRILYVQLCTTDCHELSHCANAKSPKLMLVPNDAGSAAGSSMISRPWLANAEPSSHAAMPCRRPSCQSNIWPFNLTLPRKPFADRRKAE